MTNMELLFKTALSLNQFLAQCLTTELCQGTMPASQGRQCIPPAACTPVSQLRAPSPNQSSKSFPLSIATQLGHPEIRGLLIILLSLQTKADISIRAQDKPHRCVGLWIVKPPLTLILNTIQKYFSLFLFYDKTIK